MKSFYQDNQPLSRMLQPNRKTYRESSRKIGYVLLCGFGYFFGYSLVAVMSVGLCQAEDFSTLIRGNHSSHRYPFFKKHGNYYLAAQHVAVLGYLFLASVAWLMIRSTT
ncbi:MAG: hypothetical protein AAGA30_09700 [Planctomycetota bacterium]